MKLNAGKAINALSPRYPALVTRFFNFHFIRDFTSRIFEMFCVSNHPPFAPLPQVPKGIESRGFVEFFLVYPVRSLNLSVVLRGSWADAFVVYASLRQKRSRKFGASMETGENPFPLAYDLSEN